MMLAMDVVPPGDIIVAGERFCQSSDRATVPKASRAAGVARIVPFIRKGGGEWRRKRA
jgi:hypothetical protein